MGASAADRVLIVHHGRLPSAGQACRGGVLRALQHAESLRAAGRNVQLLAREQDQAGGYRSYGELRRMAAAAAPDWILCVAPTEATALHGIAPLVVDLYAPRLLEAAWEEAQQEEAGRALRAIHVADQVLFSNARQRWFWLGILGLCGWDLRQPAGLLIPLAAPQGPPRRVPEHPRFILGGMPWPWQESQEILAQAVAFLGARAEIVSVGLPQQPGVRALPAGGYADWLELCASSTAALDRYQPNPEREMALSFRQMDYLGCGLPMIGMKESVLAQEIKDYQAGWIEESLEEALEAALGEAQARCSAGALALRQKYQRDLLAQPLLDWQPTARPRPWSVLRDAARYAAAMEAGRGARARAEQAALEVTDKRKENQELAAQNRALTASIEALSAAMADMAAFRKETAVVLGTRLSGTQATNEQLRRELEIMRADLDKKTQELEAIQSERGRLERTLLRLTGRR